MYDRDGDETRTHRMVEEVTFTFGQLCYVIQLRWRDRDRGRYSTVPVTVIQIA